MKGGWRQQKRGARIQATRTGHYASKREAAYADELRLRRLAGVVLYWLEQVPIRLPGNTTYRVDFQVFYRDGTVHYVDVKGYETEVFKLKKRMVEDLYPIEIEVV